MPAKAFPMLWIRIGEGAPVEAGVYVRASDVAAWLRDVGEDALAELMDETERAPATASHTVIA